ncbi:MAG: response regulator [Gammaproteobacteria bacterium]
MSSEDANPTRGFNETAKSLARNPLGIIALFIVLVYGFASLVTAVGGDLRAEERLPLIWFLVVFPVLVLGVFGWLVSRHSGKLYSPRDFRNEENWLRMMEATASLTVAAIKTPGRADVTSELSVSSGSVANVEPDVGEIIEAVRSAVRSTAVSIEIESWRSHILWVDDLPDNNMHERRAFEAIGLRFTLALNTDDAIARIRNQRFAAVISDMGRPEGDAEGFVLLDWLRSENNATPFFFYTSSSSSQARQEAKRRGAQGLTNNPNELFKMVTRAVVQRGW